jgi:hypothetical protein
MRFVDRDVWGLAEDDFRKAEAAAAEGAARVVGEPA